jgi:ataxin-3
VLLLAGYSVFAVVQADPTAQLALPRTDADEVASTLPEPTSAPQANSQMFARTVDRGSSRHHPTDLEDIEDDDYELQAALQASLMTNGTDRASFDPPPLARAPIPLPESRLSSPSGSSPDSGFLTPQLAAPAHEDVDPVAASMERNRILLQRMKEEQEYAQRELWADTVRGSGETAGIEGRRLRQEEEEQTELRRAIEESEEFTKQNRISRDGDNGEDYVMADRELHASGSNPYPSSHILGGNRVYDDDDAELQAALKASLESVPPGWQHLEPNLSPSRPASLPSADQTPVANRDVEDVQSASSDSATDQHPSIPETAEPLSVDDIRRKRLAKFGV